jgi:CO/xanthine dehydrogenase Mo-binding subunit
VLLKAAELSNWKSQDSLGDNRALGIACAIYKSSYAAHVAEVERLHSGNIRLLRITAVLDCGMAVNPIGIRAQMEGAVCDGITVATKGRITIVHGQPRELNFDSHPVARFADMPEIRMHIMDSTEPPASVGEPPFPSVIPAITSAVYRLTGESIRSLPIRMEA